MIESKNVKTVLEILQDEIRGDVAAALSKMDPGYTMTWVYKSPKGALFPVSKPDFKAEMKEVYKIEGRKYDIKNVAEGEHVVMVELIESYPDPETKKLHHTPLVLVIVVRDGKVMRLRDYCYTQISCLDLDKKDIEGIYKK